METSFNFLNRTAHDLTYSHAGESVSLRAGEVSSLMVIALGRTLEFIFTSHQSRLQVVLETDDRGGHQLRLVTESMAAGQSDNNEETAPVPPDGEDAMLINLDERGILIVGTLDSEGDGPNRTSENQS